MVVAAETFLPPFVMRLLARGLVQARRQVVPAPQRAPAHRDIAAAIATRSAATRAQAIPPSGPIAQKRWLLSFSTRAGRRDQGALAESAGIAGDGVCRPGVAPPAANFSRGAGLSVL